MPDFHMHRKRCKSSSPVSDFNSIRSVLLLRQIWSPVKKIFLEGIEPQGTRPLRYVPQCSTVRGKAQWLGLDSELDSWYVYFFLFVCLFYCLIWLYLFHSLVFLLTTSSEAVHVRVRHWPISTAKFFMSTWNASVLVFRLEMGIMMYGMKWVKLG